MKKLLILVLLLCLGYFLVAFLRPYLVKNNYFDFGIGFSGTGLIAILISFILFDNDYLGYLESKLRLNIIFIIFIIQEIFCYFFPRIIGTFDYLDIIYYFLGYIIAYRLYVFPKKKQVVNFINLNIHQFHQNFHLILP